MKLSDERLISALLSCSTNKEAAAVAGISEKQLYNRMKSPEFQTKYSEAKALIVERSVTEIQRHVSKAIDTMAKILDQKDASPQVRLNAADAIIRNSLRMAEQYELRAEILELREMLVNEK